jgi:hypothetical protein
MLPTAGRTALAPLALPRAAAPVGRPPDLAYGHDERVVRARRCAAQPR